MTWRAFSARSIKMTFVTHRMLAAAMLALQPFALAGSTGSTAPVSLSVMATDMCTIDQSGRGTLDLLVLWRGTLGWFRKGNGGGSGGGGSTAGPGDPGTIRNSWISEGGVQLNVRFDAANRKAWIQDTEIDLGEANVILVDHVDSPTGPQVVRTLRIPPEYETVVETLPGGPIGRGSRIRPQAVPVQTFIKRSPELVEFLQCDRSLPGLQPYEQQVFAMWCAWVNQP